MAKHQLSVVYSPFFVLLGCSHFSFSFAVLISSFVANNPELLWAVSAPNATVRFFFFFFFFSLTFYFQADVSFATRS